VLGPHRARRKDSGHAITLRRGQLGPGCLAERLARPRVPTLRVEILCLCWVKTRRNDRKAGSSGEGDYKGAIVGSALARRLVSCFGRWGQWPGRPGRQADKSERLPYHSPSSHMESVLEAGGGFRLFGLWIGAMRRSLLSL